MHSVLLNCASGQSQHGNSGTRGLRSLKTLTPLMVRGGGLFAALLCWCFALPLIQIISDCGFAMPGTCRMHRHLQGATTALSLFKELALQSFTIQTKNDFIDHAVLPSW